MKTTVRFKEVQITDGVSKAGKDWQKAMVVTNTINKEPKLIVFSTMKPELITSLRGLKEGVDIEVDFAIESREFNGKYYTDAVLYEVRTVVVNKSKPISQDGELSDNLPFN